MRSILTITCVAMLALVILPWTSMATGQSNFPNYIFLVASGFLCDSGDASTCPAAAKGTQGDSYELSGAGTFDAPSKSVKAAGTFAHKALNGNVLDSGVWIATELRSFNSYGIAPGALRQKGVALGLPPIGPKRVPKSTVAIPAGGLAVFRIRLLPITGPPMTAVLQVNCPLGEVPRERLVEGIRLSMERGGNEFSEEMGGRVVFLAAPGGG